jgi:hypothetical protein
MLRALIIILPLALAVYALVDLVQTPDDDVQGLPKLAWVVLIVLIWVVGPVAWLIAGKRGPSLLSRLLPRTAGPGPVPGHQVAPDADPDFRRGLRRSSPPTPPPAPPVAGVGAPDLEEFERDLGADETAGEDDDGREGPDPDDPPLTSR